MASENTPPLRLSSKDWRKRALWPVLLVLTIFFASGESDVAAPGFIPDFDKMAHFGVFGLLATLLVRMFFDERRPLRSGLIAAALVSLWGIADEFRQSFTPGRTVAVSDWLADTLGAMTAMALYCGWPRWRLFWERSLQHGSGRENRSVETAAAGATASLEES